MVRNIDPAGVAVLIPTLNEAHQIESVLNQIIGGDVLAKRCTVIVADGGSTDETCKIVTRLQERYPNLQLLKNPRRIQAAAMNLLLLPEFERIEYAVRCDAHAAYPQGYVSDLIQCLLVKDTDSVVVPMDAIPDSDLCFQRGLAWIADTPLGAGGSPHRGGVLSGYCDHGHHAAFRMSTFRKLGGYDTNFRTNEDAEYDQRLAEIGGNIWLNAKVRINYFPRRSPGSLWKQYFRYGAGRAQTCLKHRVRPALRQLVPLIHTVLLVISLMTLFVTPISLIWPVAYLALIGLSGILIACRKRSLCGLTAAVALATMHLSWGLGFLSQLASRVSRPPASQPPK